MRLYSIVFMLVLLVSVANGVVLLGKWDRLTCKVVTDSIQGTGFVLRLEGKVFIVTNKHLVEPGKTTFAIGVKSPSRDSTNSEVSAGSTIKPSASMYFWDENYDLAFVHVTKYSSQLDITVIPESLIGDDSATIVGQGVYFLGYPSGLHGRELNTPLVRGGIIAGETEHMIILDGNVFGGSSGSPVFLDPSPEIGQLNSSLLIGVVSELKTTPTKSHRQVRENMGIGYAIKIHYLRDAIRKWLASQNR